MRDRAVSHPGHKEKLYADLGDVIFRTALPPRNICGAIGIDWDEWFQRLHPGDTPDLQVYAGKHQVDVHIDII